VEDGGTLYASGRAAEYIEWLWPEVLGLASPDPYVGSADTGEPVLSSKVTETHAAQALGFTDFDAHPPENPWPPILEVWPTGISTIVKSDASSMVNTELIENLPPGNDLTDIPMSCSFTRGDGFVVFTNLYYRSDMDADERALTEYLVSLALMQPYIRTSRDLVNMAGYYPMGDWVGVVSEPGQRTFSIDLSDADDVYFVLNSDSFVFKLTVEGPGDIEENITGRTPISMAFPGVEDGTWTVTVAGTAEHSPYRVPFALTVGIKTDTQEMVTTEPEVIWRTPFEPDTYTITLRVIDDHFRADEFTVGLIVE